MRFGDWRRPWPATILLAALLIGLPSASLFSQQPTQPPTAPAESKPAPPPDPDAWDRLIYVPFQNLKSIFDKQGSTVFLPFADYVKLWEKLGRTASDKPSVTAVIAESHYVARVEKDLAKIEATLVVQALGKNWSEVPLKFGDAAIGKLNVADEKILLRGTGKGSYALSFPEPGKHEVKLELLARVRTSPEGRSLELECPPVGITTFEISIPEADQTVELTPKLVVLPIEAAAGQTRIKSNLGSTDKIAATWHPRAGSKPQMELLAAVSNALSISIDERIVHADAQLTYEVLRGELSQLRFAVPAGHRILDVSAGDVRLKGWKATPEPNRQVVVVDLLSSTRGKVTLDVHTEGPVPAEAFDLAGAAEQGAVHGIHALDVVRERGTLTVSSVRSIELAIEQQQGLTRLEAAEIDAAQRKEGALYFRFYSPSFQLRSTAKPVEARIVVAQSSRLSFGEDELRLQADLSYEVERAGVFEFVLKVPDGLTIDSVQAASMKSYRFDEAAQLLRISFDEKIEGKRGVTVLAHRPLADGGAGEQTLPLLEPTGVSRETGTVFVFGPQGVELVTDDTKISGAHPETPANVAEPPQMRLVSAWSYSSRPVELSVRVVRKPTRLSAHVASRVSVNQELASVEVTLDYNVEHAAVDTYRFSVPESVADRVQVAADGADAASTIKQQSRDEEAVDGWVGWTVVMQQKGIGEQSLRMTYDLKPTQGDPKSPATIDFAPPRALGLKDADGNEQVPLAQVEGEIVVAKDRALSVSAEVTGSDLEAIDVRELTLLASDGADLAYRYYKQPVALKIASTKPEVQGVVQTVVSKALIEAVVSRDPVSPMATYRCRYRVRTSERQRLRIDLPSEAQPLGVTIDGRQTPLEKSDAKADSGWTPYLVSVARTTSSDAPFVIAMHLQRPISPAPFQSNGGKLQVSIPRIGGTDGGVAVQQMRVALWVPDKFALVGTPAHYQRETVSYLRRMGFGSLTTHTQAAALENWFGEKTTGLIDFPTEGHAYQYSRLGHADALEVRWWHMPFLTTILSLAVVGIAFALLRTAWENRLGILLIAGLILALCAVYDSDAVLHVLAAVRYGVAALVGIWLIHAILGSRGVSPSLAAPAGGASVPLSGSDPPPSPENSAAESEKHEN